MTVQPVVVILGPTAVGKSELSLNLAEQFQTEIINADSMQLYQGMDIGTAKLPPIERRGIKHHLLDVYPVTQIKSKPAQWFHLCEQSRRCQLWLVEVGFI